MSVFSPNMSYMNCVLSFVNWLISALYYFHIHTLAVILEHDTTTDDHSYPEFSMQSIMYLGKQLCIWIDTNKQFWMNIKWEVTRWIIQMPSSQNRQKVSGYRRDDSASKSVSGPWRCVKTPGGDVYRTHTHTHTLLHTVTHLPAVNDSLSLSLSTYRHRHTCRKSRDKQSLAALCWSACEVQLRAAASEWNRCLLLTAQQ